MMTHTYRMMMYPVFIGLLAIICSPHPGIARESSHVVAMAFGLSRGGVAWLDLRDWSVTTFQTTLLGRTDITLGLEYFPDAETLVFFVHGEQSRKLGLIDLAAKEVTYWVPEEIGRGPYLIGARLSSALPNRVYGLFAPSSWEMFTKHTTAEDFEKTIRVGAFDVLTETWEEVPYSSQADWKRWYDPRLDWTPEWPTHYQPLWDALQAQGLVSHDARTNDLLLVDAFYVVFRSGDALVLGRRHGEEITVEQRLTPANLPNGRHLLDARCVALIYAPIDAAPQDD